jgi:hypothetical protein
LTEKRQAGGLSVGYPNITCGLSRGVKGEGSYTQIGSENNLQTVYQKSPALQQMLKISPSSRNSLSIAVKQVVKYMDLAKRYFRHLAANVVP